MRATIVKLRSGASVTDANESIADTSSGSVVPPTPAISVASTSRSGPFGNGGNTHVNTSREMEALRRLGPFRQLEHLVLEGQQRPRLDLECEMQVEWATARILGMKVDLPRLA